MDTVEGVMPRDSLFRDIPIGLCLLSVADPDGGRILAANRAAERITRRTEAETRGMTLLEAFPLLAGTDLPARAAAAVARGKIEEFEVHYPEESGRGERHFKFRILPVGPSTCCIAFEETTDEYEARRTLEESEGRLRKLLERGWDIVALATREGRVKFISPVVEDLLGFAVDECRGMRAMALVAPEDEELVRMALEGVMTSSVREAAVEARLLHRDGTRLWFELRLSDVTGDPELAGVLLNARAVGERRAMQEALRRSLDEKTVLLKEVHHRVKNNFQVITSLLGIQARNLADAAVRAELLEAEGRIRAMALIHERLYKSSNFARVPFHRYVESLVAELGSGFGARSRGIAVELRLEPIELDIDLAVPCGLFANEAATNAFKYAFPAAPAGAGGGAWGTRLVVALAREGEGARLTIEDDGPGLPTDYDGENPTSLGLSLLGLLAGQIDGKLELGPGGSGRGFRVALSFPFDGPPS